MTLVTYLSPGVSQYKKVKISKLSKPSNFTNPPIYLYQYSSVISFYLILTIDFYVYPSFLYHLYRIIISSISIYLHIFQSFISTSSYIIHDSISPIVLPCLILLDMMYTRSSRLLFVLSGCIVYIRSS
jgi:hypothetical protein